MSTNRMIPVAFAIAVMTVASASQALAKDEHEDQNMLNQGLPTMHVSAPSRIWNQPSSTNLTLKQAEQLVRREVSGTISDGKMLGFNDKGTSKLMYDFTVKNGDKIQHVMVDAKTGKFDLSGKPVAMNTDPISQEVLSLEQGDSLS